MTHQVKEQHQHLSKLLYDNDEIGSNYFDQVNLLPYHQENMEYSLTIK